jgi:hypothetical protein
MTMTAKGLQVFNYIAVLFLAKITPEYVVNIYSLFIAHFTGNEI